MIQDHEQRHRAINPSESFIVQAPAGSGKTELLIQRYLRLLSLVEAPEEIVAITFTRKAAAEMQSRVLSALKRAQSGTQADSNHEKLSLELAEAALKRNEELAWHITDNPARLRIQTIDSLCASLSRQMPMLANLGAQPEIIDDPGPIYEQAATNTLLELETGQHWSDAIARLLVHLDNDLPRLKRLLVDMLGKRDQWLRYVTQQHDRHDMERVLQKIIQEHLVHVGRCFPAEYEKELCEIAQYAAENLQQEKPDNVTMACLGMACLPGDDVDDLRSWLGLCELLLTRDGINWRKRLNKNNGFPPASGNKLEAEKRKSMKMRVESLLQKLQEISGLQNALSQLRRLPATIYTDDEWQVVEALCQLLLLSEAQLRVIFAERNQMDFSGISQAAICALGEDESPTNLALHLDFQLHHLLVDEYQDVSINQYILLQRLIAAWSMEEQKSLFLVGDPMQSIYRFREAEVALFIQTWQQQYLGQISLVPIRLKVNFRSSNLIVNWVNEQFQEIMPEEDDDTTGAVSYEPSVAFHKTSINKAVQIHPFLNRSDLDESQKVVSIVQSLQKKDKDASIALLVRSRTHLHQILPSLKQAGIGYRAIDIEPLARQPAIQDLLALTRALSHLADRIAWLAVLRAPWCGLDMISMLTLFGKHKDMTIWECINDEGNLKSLDMKSTERLVHLRDSFDQALQQKQRQSLRRSVESLWLKLAGPATLENETELEDVQAFFEILEAVDEGGELRDLRQLLNTMDDLYAAADNNADIQLQIMSMHKAKGLEFDHVILPGLGRRSRSGRNDLMRWMMRPSDQELIMAPIKESGAEEGDTYNYLKQLDQSKQFFEDARLLYVAVTRAKKSLHLLGHANIKVDHKTGEMSVEADKRSLLNHLWPNIKEFYESSLAEYSASLESEETVVFDQTLKRLDTKWQIPEPKILFDCENFELEETENKTLIEYEWAGENIKHVGTTVHQFIQRVAEDGAEIWDEEKINDSEELFIDHLKYLGVIEKDLSWTCKRVKEAMLGMIKDERGQWLLNKEHSDGQNEFALTGLYQNKVLNVKIDRTFVDEKGIRWIVDYKTSRHEESDIDSFLDQEYERYKEQLEKYAVIMQGYDKREIRLGLYFPLLQGWREWELNSKYE